MPLNKIIVADDEESMRWVLSKALKRKGFSVDLAKDGDEAWKQVEANSPDLISLDISMPQKSGIKFYREMKASDRWKKIPIIIVTGVSEDMRQFLSSRHQVPPPEGYLAKPIRPEEILPLIHKLMSTG